MREPGSGTRSVFEDALRSHDVQLHATLTFGSSEAVKQGVRSGLGLGCLSELAIRNEVASGDLVTLKVKELHLQRRLWRIAKEAGYQSKLQQACIEHMSQEPKSPAKRSRHQ